MCDFFSTDQQTILDHICRTGTFTGRQVALLLPRLVEYILAHDEALAGELNLKYGDRSEILEKLGADLLEGRQAAKELFENMISKTKKSH